MDGHPKDAATFARVSGYVEQVSPYLALTNVLEQIRTMKHRACHQACQYCWLQEGACSLLILKL